MGESLRVSARASNFGTEEIFREKIPNKRERIFFRDIAKFLWPDKTDYEIALRSGESDRTVRNCMEGKHKASGAAIRVILGEIIARLR